MLEIIKFVDFDLPETMFQVSIDPQIDFVRIYQ